MKNFFIKYLFENKKYLQSFIFYFVAFLAVLVVIHLYQKVLTVPVRTYGGNYHEGIIGTARFINPVLAQSNADKDLTKLTFGSLLSVDTKGNIEYQIAEKLEVSEDFKTYTVTINPKARFSDGTPIMASDLAFTVQKIQSPNIKSPLFSRWAGVDVQVVGNYEVKFILDQAYTDFVYHLSIGVLPQHVWQDTSDEEFTFSTYNTQPVSSGWYQVVAVEFEQDGSPKKFTLKPNTHTFNRAYIDTITISKYRDTEELKKAYVKGEVDGAYGISPIQLSNMKVESIHSGILPRKFGVFFNTAQNKELLSANVRNAIHTAIERESFVNEVFNGYASPTYTPITETKNNTSNTAKAQQLLTDDGWQKNDQGVLTKSIAGKELPLSFTLSVLNVEEMMQVSEIFKSQLAELGIVINIRSHDESTLTNEILRNRDYDAVLFGYVLEKPSDLFAFWHSSQINDPGLNIAMYSNPRTDAYLNNLRIKSDRETDIKNFLALWEKDMPSVFLYSPDFVYLSHNTFEVPKNLTSASDRFNNVHRWYLRTNHIWKFLVREQDTPEVYSE